MDRNLVENGIDRKLVWTENWYGPKSVNVLAVINNVIDNNGSG